MIRKLTVLLVLFVLLLVGFRSSPVTAQDVEGTVELTKVERLEFSGLMQSLQIATLQIQILQTQFMNAVAERDAKQAELVRSLEQLRVAHSAPVNKFTFDPETFKFVPIPVKEEVKEE